MADSDAGTALTFMTSAQRNFNKVWTLVAEMLKGSKDARDAEIAANNARLDEQGMVLIGVLLCVIVIGCLVSIVVARIITAPVVKIAGASTKSRAAIST